jgi:hypothetical protein
MVQRAALVGMLYRSRLLLPVLDTRPVLRTVCKLNPGSICSLARCIPGHMACGKLERACQTVTLLVLSCPQTGAPEDLADSRSKPIAAFVMADGLQGAVK